LRAHAKATSAGPIEGSGNSRSLFRCALATRAAPLGANGSGASSLRLIGLLGLALAALLALTAGSASAATTRQLQTQITEADGAPFGNPLGLASRDTFLRAGASA